MARTTGSHDPAPPYTAEVSRGLTGRRRVVQDERVMANHSLLMDLLAALYLTRAGEGSCGR
jgi:hypothetical protein